MAYLEPDTQAIYRKAQIIWGAMAASLLVYVLLAVLMYIYEAPFHGFGQFTPEIQQMLRVIFIVIGLASIPFTPWILEKAQPLEETPLLVSRTVIAVAFADIPAIFGLLFYLMTAGIPEFIGGLGVTAVLLAYYFPRPGGPTDPDRE